jgi:hypothetical protein
MRFASHGGLTCVALNESACNCNGVTHTHGGLTAAALDCRFCSGWNSACLLPHSAGVRLHGGLTPAALVDMRLCNAKIAIPPAHGRCSSARSGGRKPPWNTFRMRTRNGQIHRIAVADAVCNPRRAEVRGVERKHSQLQRRYSHPRRADARRSCGCAFVHRKNRHSSGTRSL